MKYSTGFKYLLCGAILFTSFLTSCSKSEVGEKSKVEVNAKIEIKPEAKVKVKVPVRSEVDSYFKRTQEDHEVKAGKLFVKYTDEEPFLPPENNFTILAGEALDNDGHIWIAFRDDAYRRENGRFTKFTFSLDDGFEIVNLKIRRIQNAGKNSMLFFAVNEKSDKPLTFCREAGNFRIISDINNYECNLFTDNLNRVWWHDGEGVWLSGKRLIRKDDLEDQIYPKFSIFDGLVGRVWVTGPDKQLKNKKRTTYLFCSDGKKTYTFDGSKIGTAYVDFIGELEPGKVVFSGYPTVTKVFKPVIKDGGIYFMRLEGYDFLKSMHISEIFNFKGRVFVRARTKESIDKGYESSLLEIKKDGVSNLIVELDRNHSTSNWDRPVKNRIWADKAGNLWIGTYNNGIYALLPSGEIRHAGIEKGFNLEKTDNMLEDEEALYFFRDGAIRDLNYGVQVIGKSKLDSFFAEKGPGNFTVFKAEQGFVKDGSGDLWWIAKKTKEGVLVRWDGKELTDVLPLKEARDLALKKTDDLKLQSIGADSLGRIWILYVSWQGGMQSYACIYDPKDKSLRLSTPEKEYKESVVSGKDFNIEINNYLHRPYFLPGGKVIILNEGNGPEIKVEPDSIKYEKIKYLIDGTWKIFKPKLEGKDKAYFRGGVYFLPDGKPAVFVANNNIFDPSRTSDIRSAVLEENIFVTSTEPVPDLSREKQRKEDLSLLQRTGVYNGNSYLSRCKFEDFEIFITTDLRLKAVNGSSVYEIPDIPVPNLSSEFCGAIDKKGKLVLAFGRYNPEIIIFNNGLQPLLKTPKAHQARYSIPTVERKVKAAKTSETIIKPVKLQVSSQFLPTPESLFEMLMGEDPVKVKQAENGFLISGEKGKCFLKEKLNNPRIDESLRFKIEALLSRME